MRTDYFFSIFAYYHNGQGQHTALDLSAMIRLTFCTAFIEQSITRS